MFGRPGRGRQMGKERELGMQARSGLAVVSPGGLLNWK